MVILSALVPGEVAPVLVTEEMVKAMKPGSVIVDVSVDQGGNCGSPSPGRSSSTASSCRPWNIPGSMPVHASWLYGNNMLHFVENLFETGRSAPDYEVTSSRMLWSRVTARSSITAGSSP